MWPISSVLRDKYSWRCYSRKSWRPLVLPVILTWPSSACHPERLCLFTLQGMMMAYSSLNSLLLFLSMAIVKFTIYLAFHLDTWRNKCTDLSAIKRACTGMVTWHSVISSTTPRDHIPNWTSWYVISGPFKDCQVLANTLSFYSKKARIPSLGFESGAVCTLLYDLLIQ